ncbi:winged helix-turn-helix domain-containing protein [Streptomyces sp. NPDC060011]|uniref:winged helix-turn-helix domain-containing protein n=1 Tax=unclassified Streptomyces TaxID=2593676 RepID=UPI0013BC0FA5|nr:MULTISPECIES: winged helix-turn-helix domain-containing protein [unclassified Streptomyces]MCX4914326.1 winged helix-turn-helix domain-containing protein [Streptomyces sp. NBC_00687]MCX5133560.1 winged helix-turn-helix domain-containing protein [Streptomyces sp. NBC_00340]MCX5282910.1 winged helix-turn-helix domain-containing protein [Streptomyces sp. NBC_00198]NEB32479.1 winged helix-turn-helix transcriptional regulator [Streptomyces sp. SID14446]WSD80074.1 winged helix-turn-helix domain-c
MATTRSFSSVATAPTPSTSPGRHRLRAVDRDEVVDVSGFLPPGATWLPAPPHTLPVLPGQPPMIGYLVLVPADQQPLLPVAVPDRTAPDGDGPSLTGTGAGDPLVRIDTVQRTAEVDGRILDLTYLEFELLAHLVQHPHRVHTRDQLVSTVWGYGHVGDGRTVDVHVARLRRKLGAQHRQSIQTVRRVGYKFAPPTGR